MRLLSSTVLLVSAALASVVSARGRHGKQAGGSPSGPFTGTAKSAMTGDFMPNQCGYDEFSSQFISAAESRFAYVTKNFWDHDLACGRCASVSLRPAEDPKYMTPNSTVTVMLISHFPDECGSSRDCSHDLLLSQQAYRDMLNGGTGSRFGVKWEIVECPEDFVSGGIELAFGDATNEHILTVQPRNFVGQISGLEARFESGERVPFGAPGENAKGSYRAAIAPEDGPTFDQPFTLVVSQAISGATIEVEVEELPEPHQVIAVDEQF
ncbi:hypothetical protein P43SY_004827 [Pythium insidiosum]|uniref:Expansin-like EG45 domain-containing protein n=1 Tax=Pythium insidiosum TaxID=114742 RepID=A0AAD5QAB6_PYTIN|nr:hypothetical protein P43SY_004827 [Pythium insidiosum]